MACILCESRGVCFREYVSWRMPTAHHEQVERVLEWVRVEERLAGGEQQLQRNPSWSSNSRLKWEEGRGELIIRIIKCFLCDSLCSVCLYPWLWYSLTFIFSPFIKRLTQKETHSIKWPVQISANKLLKKNCLFYFKTEKNACRFIQIIFINNYNYNYMNYPLPNTHKVLR